MIVAITGATGHLGVNLARALVAKRYNVRGVIPGDDHNVKALGIESFKGDIRDPYSLNRAFAGAEVVYHAASIALTSETDWPILESINITGTRNVVEACLHCNVGRLVYFSSIAAILQEPMNTPVDELRPLAETDECPPLARSMAAAEREVRKGIELGLDAVLLNPTGLIGPNDYELSRAGQILLAMAQGKLPALVDGGYNFVDVRDVVRAALRAGDVAPTGAKYLLSGAWASFRELADLIENITGKSQIMLTLPSWLARGGGPVVSAFNQITRQRIAIPEIPFKDLGKCNTTIGHDRASAELNYDPRELSESLVDTLRWYQESGRLDRSIKLRNLPVPEKP